MVVPAVGPSEARQRGTTAQCHTHTLAPPQHSQHALRARLLSVAAHVTKYKTRSDEGGDQADARRSTKQPRRASCPQWPCAPRLWAMAVQHFLRLCTAHPPTSVHPASTTVVHRAGCSASCALQLYVFGSACSARSLKETQGHMQDASAPPPAAQTCSVRTGLPPPGRHAT